MNQYAQDLFLCLNSNPRVLFIVESRGKIIVTKVSTNMDTGPTWTLQHI